MVNVLDLLKEQKSLQKVRTAKNDARDHFVSQKKSLEAIKETPWFKEIVQYWEREVVACQERLRTMKSTDIKAVQAEMDIAMRFVEFIENILSADIKI